MKYKKTILMSLGIIALIIFSGCSSIEFKARPFCNEKVSEFSNVTEIKYVYIEDGYVGCSDGYRIKWYRWDYYDNDNTLKIPISEIKD